MRWIGFPFKRSRKAGNEQGYGRGAKADPDRSPKTGGIKARSGGTLADLDAQILLDLIPAYVTIHDVNRTILQANEAFTRDFGSAVTALRPETSIADAHADPQWDDHLWLPVADFNDRVIGSVERKSLATEMEAAPSEPLIDSALLLGQEYLRVSSALLDSLLRGWSRL